MPTYDYQCDACDHKFELYHGINEPARTKCPECKKNKLRRLLGTGSAVVFKGSGFYQTDYRSDSYNKAKAADKPADSSSGSSDSKSSDSKSSDSKSSDSKSSGSKSTDSKSSSSSNSPKTSDTPKKTKNSE